MFEVSGKCTFSGYSKVHITVNNAVNRSVSVYDKISVLDGSKKFSQIVQIPVQLADFDLNIYLQNTNADEVLVKTVSRITAGDVFIIAGQSNALAASNSPYNGPPLMQSLSTQWNRGIGTHEDPEIANYPCGPQSYDFAEPNSNWLWNGFVGTWGLTLQFNLSLQTGIPSCFVNGARVSSSISMNLPSHFPTDTTLLDSCNIYDRLYNKIKQNQLNAAVKGIFWYQGETDGVLSYSATCEYLNKFDLLYHAWKKDYPNVQKIFLIQVNTGCNDINLSLIREIERKISYKYADVVLMTSFNMNETDRTSDLCHATVEGYNQLADNLLPLVKKYVYKQTIDEKTILPPKIVRAFYSSERKICLEFDTPVSLQQSKKYSGENEATAYIKDYFYAENNGPLAVESVTSKDNFVYLNLSEYSPHTNKVTYLPHSYTIFGALYVGPWITNQSNTLIAAASFYDYPISSSSNNLWDKSWTNYGSGYIKNHQITDQTVLYTGNFRGGNAGELLCIDEDKKRFSLFEFKNSDWNLIADDRSDSAFGANLIGFTKKLLVADFDGDGIDELLATPINNKNRGYVLFKIIDGHWQKIWFQNNNQHTLYNYGENIYVGDFNGDGQSEILAIGKNKANRSAMFYFNGSDFVSREFGYDESELFSQYSGSLLATDLDGDGSCDLLQTNGFHSILTFKNNKWTLLSVTNSRIAFENFDRLLPESTLFFSANIDTTRQNEIIALKTGSQKSGATIMNLKFSDENTSWRYKYEEGSIQSINDWSIENYNDNTQQIYFTSPNAKGASDILLTKRESCGYLVNMYRFTGKNDYAAVAEDFETSRYKNDFLIFPNPTNGLITFLVPENTDNTISIYDIQGKELLNLKNQSGSVTTDLSFLEEGMYLVKLQNQNGITVKKVILK